MSATKKEAQWPMVVNLSNSIIGVSVLAMPFCLKQCGILLGAVLLMGSNILTRVTSHLLMKGATLARKNSYEFYSQHIFGKWGKLGVELMMVMFLLSTLCAFFVVIGDLGPQLVGDALGVGAGSSLRILVMFLVGLWVILPLSLLRRIQSLSHISSLAILFYGFFVVRMLLAAVPVLLDTAWVSEVNWWRMGGVLQCLPIFALSLSCQTQLFVTAETMLEPSPGKMDSVVAGAVNLCSSVYLSVGFFGYVTFRNAAMSGDVLVLLESSFVTQVIKLLFILSVAVSFPLMLFPCRSAIYTMLFKPSPASVLEATDALEIPDIPFRAITTLLLASTLFVAILVPNVELVLGLTGALIGSGICVILPAALFLAVAPPTQLLARVAAQVCLVLGAFMMIVCTYATLHGSEAAPHADLVPLNIPDQKGAAVTSTTAPLPIHDPQKRELEKAVEKPMAVDVLQNQGRNSVRDGKEVDKAAELVQELKAQQVEQKKLLNQQKQLIRELKDQAEDTKRAAQPHVSAARPA